MKVGDLVRLNEKNFEHPAYRNGVLYLVKNVLCHGRIGRSGSSLVDSLVELYTPDGALVAFKMSELEVVSESM